MPPATPKTRELDVLATSFKVSALCLAVVLAGCQSNSQPENRAYQADLHMTQSKMQRPPEWLRKAPTAAATSGDIWDRVRDGYQLQGAGDNGTNPRIDRQRLWYASHEAALAQSCSRGAPYLHYIVERLEERNMPLELALLPVVESSFNPNALSRSAASGLWQFIPTTGKYFNLRQTRFYDGRRDITASTNAALDYLSKLHDMFGGDWLLALAAYNAGEGTVGRAIERNQSLGLPTDYWNLSSLPPETQDYVPKLLAVSQIVRNPDAYGLALESIPNEPYFEVVDIKQHLDLARVAELADLDANELYRLNPAYTQRVTMDGPKHLLVPAEKAQRLVATLPDIAPEAVVQWQEYRVRRGDTLRSVAKRNRVSVEQLVALNKLSGSSRLAAGRELLIPRRETGKTTTPLETIAVAEEPVVRTYKVRTGDSLWSIARANEVELGDLKRWNDLGKRGLKVGETLKLHGTGSGTATAVAMPASYTVKATQAAVKTTKNAKAAPTYYRVKAGDSLYQIAKRYNIGVQALQDWNPRVASALTPGQTLTLFLN
ncbi:MULTISPECIES: lytic transglycosylase domain-containing protein [Pseudomonas]|uniref:lytic transglycosylase domain-containing protein n=1 Tax=Pseudomonas TaxID=286 RepID=UPI000304CEEA|nr:MULTISPECIES: lytic transglycosylase domain-containing protein [Pseudomonas]MDC7830274.1 LysM peptidoglycan-binding domain-containing protein [Pseudomonas benzopyrenica]NRH41176.1 LysM peptidoglycan-binding domain-containing protein [Pseudomonas sp. MS15a(2019)]UUW73048.1 LysM peptidoglycan-binding domain-containing protein [Pseudomonas psychrotolerans]